MSRVVACLCARIDQLERSAKQADGVETVDHGPVVCCDPPGVQCGLIGLNAYSQFLLEVIAGQVLGYIGWFAVAVRIEIDWTDFFGNL